ncbi:hypothetical protein F4678DRAFT_467338 [Xylaria arbuscula]|nr:hypothetical protein F4678DRAFT_467338 [Xylaria arbuscula]
MDENLAAGSDPARGGALRIPENNAAPASNGENKTRTEVDSPTSPSSTTVLARFEFEAGRGNEGSKILMVEWDSSHPDGRSVSAEDRSGWVVSWEEKSAAYPIHDDDKPPSAVLRVYFLLPENAPIPPSVTISHASSGRTLSTKCMPAIFAPGLSGASAPDPGRRGVLHSIWARKRLAEIQEEINAELQTNSEGVALEMAIQEKQWLIEHFGFVDLFDTTTAPRSPPLPATPHSPRSPVGGRLGEMLRGLKLSTSPADLARSPGNTPRQTPQPLPRGALNAVSVPAPKAATVGGVASLDAVMNNTQPVAPVSQARDPEDELFALPMSPRSPEMKTSPFSFLK